MTNKSPCYVYAFGSDSTTKKATRIFPDEKTSALLDYHENTIIYPSEEDCIKMDDVSGTDYFVMLYSLKELNLEDVMKNFEKQIKNQSDVYQAVKASITSGVVLDSSVTKFDANKISFEANVTNVETDMVMPVVVKIQHD